MADFSSFYSDYIKTPVQDVSKFYTSNKGVVDPLMGLAGAGADYYLQSKALDEQKKMAEQNAQYQKNLYNLAVADRDREIARQEEAEDAMQEGFAIGFDSNRKRQGITQGLAAIGTV